MKTVIRRRNKLINAKNIQGENENSYRIEDIEAIFNSNEDGQIGWSSSSYRFLEEQSELQGDMYGEIYKGIDDVILDDELNHPNEFEKY